MQYKKIILKKNVCYSLTKSFSMLEKKLRFTLSATNALCTGRILQQNFGESVLKWKRKLYANCRFHIPGENFIPSLA